MTEEATAEEAGVATEAMAVPETEEETITKGEITGNILTEKERMDFLALKEDLMKKPAMHPFTRKRDTKPFRE